jgi:hypothetical protein
VLFLFLNIFFSYSTDLCLSPSTDDVIYCKI